MGIIYQELIIKLGVMLFGIVDGRKVGKLPTEVTRPSREPVSVRVMMSAPVREREGEKEFRRR